MKENDLYWLAGLLEGEGTFLKSPPSEKNKITIQLQMTDEDVVARVATLFEVKYCCCKTVKAHYKSTFKLSVCGSKAQQWMITLKPLMGSRRQKQIEEVLNSYTPPKQFIQMPSSEELIEMNKTLSIREIAKRLGCSHQRVFKYLKNASVGIG